MDAAVILAAIVFLLALKLAVKALRADKIPPDVERYARLRKQFRDDVRRP